MSDQVCRFCQRYVQLTYYCEECGTNCCSDCLHEKKVDFYLCQECNSKNIGPPDSDKNRVCKDCGNEYYCQHCHNLTLVNPKELKAEILADLNEIAITINNHELTRMKVRKWKDK